MTNQPAPRTWPAPELRVGDADRQRVVDELQQHYVEGRLTSDELSERIAQALAARTFGDLRSVLSDLPALGVEAPPPARQPWWSRIDPAFASMLVLVGVLVVVWLVWLPREGLGPVGFLPVVIFGSFFIVSGPRRRRRRH